MKLFIVTVFSIIGFSVHAEENWKIDWSTVVPRTDVPGFFDGRNAKLSLFQTDKTRYGRIVGGEIVTPHTHPYQAGLLLRTSITSTGICGGSLITNRAVLTAAHCPEGAQSTQVILGAHNIQTIEPNQQRMTVHASSYIIHPQYNIHTISNDIAILILPSAATLNQYVALTVLPDLGVTDSFVGQTATVSGWGRVSDSSTITSPHLRSVENTIITNAVCQATFGSMVTESIICISTVRGRGICNGDSGGPLTVSSGNDRLQVGIVSFSRGCERGFPAGFVRVTSFRQWIIDNQDT